MLQMCWNSFSLIAGFPFHSVALYTSMRYGCVYVLFSPECLCCLFKPEGTGTGVDKLSSGCCLVSMGVLSYTALFFSLHFTRLQQWIATTMDGERVFQELCFICTRLKNNREQGNLLLTSSAVVNLSLPAVRTYVIKYYNLRNINTTADFFGNKHLGCRLHIMLLCFSITTTRFAFKIRLVNQQLRNASL